jgi:hypothetical protein
MYKEKNEANIGHLLNLHFFKDLIYLLYNNMANILDK